MMFWKYKFTEEAPNEKSKKPKASSYDIQLTPTEDHRLLHTYVVSHIFISIDANGSVSIGANFNRINSLRDLISELKKNNLLTECNEAEGHFTSKALNLNSDYLVMILKPLLHGLSLSKAFYMNLQTQLPAKTARPLEEAFRKAAPTEKVVKFTLPEISIAEASGEEDWDVEPASCASSSDSCPSSPRFI